MRAMQDDRGGGRWVGWPAALEGRLRGRRGQATNRSGSPTGKAREESRPPPQARRPPSFQPPSPFRPLLCSLSLCRPASSSVPSATLAPSSVSRLVGLDRQNRTADHSSARPPTWPPAPPLFFRIAYILRSAEYVTYILREHSQLSLALSPCRRKSTAALSSSVPLTAPPGERGSKDAGSRLNVLCLWLVFAPLAGSSLVGPLRSLLSVPFFSSLL